MHNKYIEIKYIKMKTGRNMDIGVQSSNIVNDLTSLKIRI